MALIALLGDDIVAVGRFDRLQSGESAEVAFVVEDGHQGRGLGSILLEHLAAAAREVGLTRFEAEGAFARAHARPGTRVAVIP